MCIKNKKSKTNCNVDNNRHQAPPPMDGNIKRGALICFEGIDHSGKSTHAELLVKALNAAGHKASMMRFPDRETVIGKMIDTYLKSKSQETPIDDRVIHLLFSANRWEKCETIRRRLMAGETLVLDRYSYSGAAYSCAKDVEGMDTDWCMGPERGLPEPDLLMYLVLNPSDAMARHADGVQKERYEEPVFLERVQTAYANIHKRRKQLQSTYTFEIGGPTHEMHWVFIDTSGEKQAVHEEVLEFASKTISEIENERIKVIN